MPSPLEALLERQRAAFRRDGAPGAAARRERLARLRGALIARRGALQQAVSADYSHRPARETDIMELLPTLRAIGYMSARLERWMAPKRRAVDLLLAPAAAKIVVQPLGVVGIMAPWNYPIALSLVPLATAIAAGNRAMLKPSELSPRTTALIGDLVAATFTAEEVAVVAGGPDVGAAFAALPFDHLIFTGGGRVGRGVMAAASANLTPVTLELGGKSPVIVDEGFSLERAAKIIAYGKLANAGQTCIAPDYALMPRAAIEPFVAAFGRAVARAYPRGAADPNYAAIVNPGHHARLTALLDDARAGGAKIVSFDGGAARAQTVPPTLVLAPSLDMRLAREEIFGPILPIFAYDDLDQALAQINAGDRPLALYLLSDRAEVVERVLSRTTSGNVSINDTLMHYAADDLPFGGVGPSGIGAYHGEEGFRTLSHFKGVFAQRRPNAAGLMRAPFGRLADFVLGRLLR
jgi:coniferyl-aldehyde dehydrogenase